MSNLEALDRITSSPEVMGGKPCIRGLRVTVATVIGMLAGGHSPEQILQAYPYLQEEDLRQSLLYASLRVSEVEVPLKPYEASSDNASPTD